MKCQICEEHECPAFDVLPFGGARFFERFPSFFADRRDIGEPPGGVGGEIPPLGARLELDRAQEGPARDPQSPAAQGTPAGFLERVGRRVREVFGDGPVELGEQLGRLIEVVSTDLGQLIPRALREPGSEGLVLLRAPRLAHSTVRNVPDQSVLEAQGDVA